MQHCKGCRYTNSIWIRALAPSFAAPPQCRPCTWILQAADYKRVGSANGGRTRIFRLLLFYKLLKPQKQEAPHSQESQPVCTKHVHGFGEVSGVAGSLDLR